MYITRLKANVVQALKKALADDFVDSRFRGTYVGIEYPMEKQHYPGIWVNYDDNDTLAIAGIDHHEYVWDHPDPSDPTQPSSHYAKQDNHAHQVTRWNFSGEITLTVVALTSLQRDDLADQLIRVYAFSSVEEADSNFRTAMENNPFIAMNVNWDELRPHGDASGQGTPWGTDEVIYEKSFAFEVLGEFVSDPATRELVNLRSIVVTATREGGDPEEPVFVEDTTLYIQ